MLHATRAGQLWRHQSLEDLGDDYTPLVHYATLAASSHNTQPWTFELSSGRVRLLPDYSRRCPVVDPDDHHLFASLGCAAENLLLAARAAGLRGHLSHLPSQRALQIELEAVNGSEGSDLFQAIPLRQCSRTAYDGTPLRSSEARKLEEAASGSGVSRLLLTEPKQVAQVADYVAEGNTAQFGDPLWRKELLQWIRFNGREAAERGDGLSGPTPGFYIDDLSLETGPMAPFDGEDFESGFGDWSSQTQGGIWNIGAPTQASGPDAHGGTGVAGTRLDADYDNARDAYLISPAFEVPATNPQVRYWRWYELRATGDTAGLSIRTRDTDSGLWSGWTELEDLSGSSGGWEQSIESLGAYAGEEAQLGFWLDTVNSGAALTPGFYVDDISIESD